MMDGSIAVESVRLGHGSVFRFRARFDLAEQSAPAEGQPSKARKAEPNALAGLRVLLVEDHPLNQQVASELLRRFGASVVVAEDGVEALNALNRQASYFNAWVLIDLQMPRMDGYAATRRLRADVRFNMPIIAMTAHALKEERQRCMDAGMRDFSLSLSGIDDLVALLQPFVQALPPTQPEKTSNPPLERKSMLNPFVPWTELDDFENALEGMGGNLGLFWIFYRPSTRARREPCGPCARLWKGASLRKFGGSRIP